LKNTINILFIEDNFIELMKMERTVSLLKLNHKITEARSVDEAFTILAQKEYFPDIILLDLNMPKVSGIEFLSILKKNSDLKHIPTIILTTSNNQKDLKKCYDIGISGYIIKPLKYDEYVEKIKIVLSYWCINELRSV
jgi:CheY-like chemotaxis protein